MADFDPFAEAPTPVPHGEETTDDIDFDQFLSSLSDQGFTYPGKNGEPTPIDPNAADPAALPEGDDEHEESLPQEQPPASTVPTVRIGDKDVPLEEVELLYSFGKTIREQGITQPSPVADETPPPPPPPAPEPEQEPEWLDQDDPVQMGMWSELRAARKESALARQSVESYRQEQSQARVAAEVQQAVASFKSAFPTLTEQEVQTITTLAAPTVSAFVAAAANPVDGIVKALRLTAMDFEPTRDRVLGVPQKSGQQKASERKSKQSSLNPSGSSASRTSVPRSAPRTDRAATQEFAAALAESFGTNGRLN